MWFRQDLRLSDNPALRAAAKEGGVFPVYILDDLSPETFALGEASKVWLHHSLLSLQASMGGKLNIDEGAPDEILVKLCQRYPVKQVFWNACFEPWYRENDERVVQCLKKIGVCSRIYQGSYLWAPTEIQKADGSPYKVFSAYKRSAEAHVLRSPYPQPRKIIWLKDQKNQATIADLNLLPQKDWHQSLETHWRYGEMAAKQKLSEFLKNKIQGYQQGRDHPGLAQTSRLSPHLHFGEISPFQIWAAVERVKMGSLTDIAHFKSELIWREFSCYLLFHFKDLPSKNFQKKFDAFPWQKKTALLRAWQQGKTGYPIVDAGMRELWQTGYMHNRVRMIVASFLVKNLLIHWHAGRDWFWDCLVDADLANNSASWQWVAGSGADAAPYFRIFNPVTQGEKFDPKGVYTLKFVPELKKIPNKYLHKPWECPENTLEVSGVVLGKTYPRPIVNLENSRNKAMAAYQKLRRI